MKIKVKKTMTHGEFAKYMVDKFGIASFERNLADGEWFGAPSDRYNASINLKPAQYDDFAHSIRIDEDGVTLKTFEEITEKTEIPTMVEIYFDKKRGVTCTDIHFNSTINEIMNSRYLNCKTFAFHKLNDDDTLTLIWRDGKMVE